LLNDLEALGKECGVAVVQVDHRPETFLVTLANLVILAHRPPLLFLIFEALRIVDPRVGVTECLSYLGLLKRNGVLCTVGIPEDPLQIAAFSVLGRKALTGSIIGGIAETQEMLDFYGQHNILSDTETTTFAEIENAWTASSKATSSTASSSTPNPSTTTFTRTHQWLPDLR